MAWPIVKAGNRLFYVIEIRYILVYVIFCFNETVDFRFLRIVFRRNYFI